jgi:hypothetical protein
LEAGALAKVRPLRRKTGNLGELLCRGCGEDCEECCQYPQIVIADMTEVNVAEKGLAAADSNDSVDHADVGKMINNRYPG